LTSRLVVTSLGLVALVSIVVATVTAFALHHYLVSRLDTQLVSASRRFLDTHGSPGGPSPNLCDPGNLQFVLAGQPPGTVLGQAGSCHGAVIVTEDGTPADLHKPDVAMLSRVAASPSPSTVDLSIGDYRVLSTSGVQVRSFVGLPLSDVNETMHSLILTEVAVAAAGVLLAAGVALALVRRQLAPLRRVAATATNVTRLPLASGDVGVIERVPAELTDPTTEVGQVGASLNAMLGHVEEALSIRHESEQRVRQFLADASHELRTPLSTIMGYAELGRRTPPDPGRLGHAMVRIQSESGRMAALVDDLLLLARLDSGRPLERTDVDLSMLLVEAVNDARVVGSDHQWRLALPAEALHVVGDRGRLHQVVANVLTNAIRHTPPATTVSVSASATPGGGEHPPGVLVTIADNGPGIPPSLAGREFERFSRGEASRARDAGGSGLGLSIVQAIVAAHGGSVAIHSVPGDTRITIWLHAAVIPVDSAPTGQVPSAR
jgi:two-component system OmpR family sensor kinase